MSTSAPNSNNQVTKTYSTWGPSGTNTVAFYMPEAITAPSAFGLALYGSDWAMPTNPVCPVDEPDTVTPDHSANNNAANTLATQAEGYQAQA